MNKIVFVVLIESYYNQKCDYYAVKNELFWIGLIGISLFMLIAKISLIKWCIINRSWILLSLKLLARGMLDVMMTVTCCLFCYCKSHSISFICLVLTLKNHIKFSDLLFYNHKLYSRNLSSLSLKDYSLTLLETL